MQECKNETLKSQITVSSLPGDCIVEGFAAAYVAYVDDRPGEDSTSVFFRLTLMALGLVIGFVGAITLVFGPSTITYNIASGLTPYQMIQVYPGPIFTLGAFLIAISSHLENIARQSVLAPEAFVRELCSFIGPDGTDYNEKIIIRYLGNDTFHIVSDQAA